MFIIISATLCLIYGCIERAIKEDWVLLDSFRKSDSSYKSLLQEITFPIFIINEEIDLLYFNKEGDHLLSSLSRGRKLRNLVTNEYVTDFELKLKECIKKDQDSKMKFIIEKYTELNGNIIVIESHYKARFRRVNWKGRSNRILLILKNIDKKIEKDIMLKNELTQIDNNLENTQNYLEKMAKISGTKECKKLIFSLKSLNSRLNAILMNKSKTQSCSFRIADYLFRFFDIFYNATIEEKIYLKLNRDAYFPEEVTGDFRKFDVAITMLLSFIINHGNFHLVELNLRMVDTTMENYVLLIKFVCHTTQEFGNEEVTKIIDHSNLEMTKLRMNTNLELSQSQIDIIMSKKIVENSLNGLFEIKTTTEKAICFDLKINFSRNIDYQNCITFSLFSPKHLPPNSSSSVEWNPNLYEEESKEALNSFEEKKTSSDTFKKKIPQLRKSTTFSNINKMQSKINIKQIVQEEIKKKAEASKNEEKIQENLYAKKNMILLTPVSILKKENKKLFSKASLAIINEEMGSERSKGLSNLLQLDEILKRKPIVIPVPAKIKMSSDRHLHINKSKKNNNNTYRKYESKSIVERIDLILEPDSYILDE